MPKQSLRIFIEIQKQPVHNKVRFTFDSQSNYHATKWVITIHNAEGKKINQLQVTQNEYRWRVSKE